MSCWQGEKILDEKLATNTIEEIISYFKEYKPKTQNCLKIGRSKSISEASDTELSDDCDQNRVIVNKGDRNQDLNNDKSLQLQGASSQVLH